ncbi:hypothetical protein [Stenotrophomonas acidaminiphila]|uniref:hypothetical protein n=1 Tax=Stenotrophomonas acidaminiphila TaxID=128780 RepID=UPI0015FD1F16|nr:hypothetical protein [Stenotrophomonas acidaminiphila]
MTPVVFSEAANKAYPFAQLLGAIPRGVLAASVILGAMMIFFAVVLPMFTGASVKKQSISLLGGLLLLFIPHIALDAVKNATLFDAPGVVLGTIQKVEVIPGTFFRPDASNVTLADGTGMSFKGSPSLPIGATIIKKVKAWDGSDYYTVQVQAGEEPYYFTAR